MEIKRYKYAIAPLIGLSILLPIIFLILYPFFEGSLSLSLEGLHISTYLLNTIYIVLGTLVLVLICGGVSAYLTARYEFFGAKSLAFMLILPLALPSYVAGYAYVGIFEYHGILSFLLESLFGIEGFRIDILNIYGCIFIFGITMFPYLFILARVSFANISQNIDELNAISGVGRLRALFGVHIPLAYPAIFAGALLASLEVVSDYGTVVYFGVESFSVGIFKTWFGYANLLGAIKIAFVMLLFVFLLLILEYRARSRYRFASMSLSQKKSSKKKLKGSANIFAFLFCFFVVLISFLLPLGVLIYWLALDISELNLSVVTYLVNTLSLNFVSSFFIVFVAFITIYFLRMYGGRYSHIVHKVSMLGYAIPGAVVGVAILIFFGALDGVIGYYLFGGSFFALLVAYTLRFYPASVTSVESGFSKIDSTLDDASKLFAKSEVSSIKNVYFPQMKSFLLSGFLIVFIDISKELPATLMLRPFNFDTLALRVYELSSNEQLSAVAAPSLALIAISFVALVIMGRVVKKGY